MSEDQPTAAYLPASGTTDLVPGMVTVVEPAGVPAGGDTAAAPQSSAQLDNFDVVLRGYDRHQVDRHLDRVAALVVQLQAELADSARRERATAAELERVRAELERGRPSFDALGERVSQMLGLAESEATQLRADAERDAAGLRGAAERDAADMRSDARRDAEELGAAARREVAELGEHHVALLTEIAAMRDSLNAILAAAGKWPSLAPSDDLLPLEGAGDPAAAAEDRDGEQDQDEDESPGRTREIDVTESRPAADS